MGLKMGVNRDLCPYDKIMNEGIYESLGMTPFSLTHFLCALLYLIIFIFNHILLVSNSFAISILLCMHM